MFNARDAEYFFDLALEYGLNNLEKMAQFHWENFCWSF